MILKILFGLCILVEAVFTPWYLKALWPEKCFKSLCLKMVCSSMFFSVGLLSMFIAGNFSQYAITMMIGFTLGWIGDYFLHAKPSTMYFIIGFSCFMLGHVVYSIAYINALPKLFTDYNQFNIIEISVILGIFIASLVFVKFVLPMKFNPKFLKYATIAYTLIIITMFTKACSLGINCYTNGIKNGMFSLITLCIGSFFFMLSDASLAIILFGGKKKNYPLKIFNIITYFWGQILLASSILFINC